MSKKQKHHYIPKFYLKRWARPDGQLIEFSHGYKNRLVVRPTFPGGTGYIRGLYSIPNAPPHVENIFENSFLNRADGLASQSLDIMLNENYVPTGSEKIAWTRFLMSLIYRTPEGVARTVEMIRKYYDEKSLEQLRPVYDKLKRPEDPDTPEEYLRLNRTDMTGRTTIQLLMDIIESDRVRDRIMSMRWELGTFVNLKHRLLTSDRPIVMTDGIGRPDSHMVLPLSPTHIFIATSTTEVAETIKSLSKNGQLVSILNDKVARQARKFVFSTDKSQLRFIENRLGDKIRCSPFE